MIPRRAARSSDGSRSGYRRRRGGRGRSSGATRSHRSSGTRSPDTRKTLPPPSPPAKTLNQTHSEMISEPVSHVAILFVAGP
jgi:hypothetical protein